MYKYVRIIMVVIIVIIIIVIIIIIIIISTRLQIMNDVYEWYVNYFSCMYTYISFYTCHILSSVAIGNMYTSTILQHKHTWNAKKIITTSRNNKGGKSTSILYIRIYISISETIGSAQKLHRGVYTMVRDLYVRLCIWEAKGARNKRKRKRRKIRRKKWKRKTGGKILVDQTGRVFSSWSLPTTRGGCNKVTKFTLQDSSLFSDDK